MCLPTLLLLVLMPCIAAQLAEDHQVGPRGGFLTRQWIIT